MCALVAAHGYAGTTVGGIAASAGVSRTTFYEQFDSKEDCFRAAYDSVAGSLIDAVEAASAPQENPRAALAAGIDAFLEWFAARPELAATFIVEVHRAGPDALVQRAAIFVRFCRVLNRNAPERHPAAAMAAVTSINAMAFELVREGRADELPRLAAAARHVAEKLLS